MRISLENFCNNKDCPLNGNTEISDKVYSAYIKVDVSKEDFMDIPVPCLICKHLKKIDCCSIYRNTMTRELLRRESDAG